MIAPLKSGEIRDESTLAVSSDLHPEESQNDTFRCDQGKVEVKFALLMAEEAERNPVGKPRECPQPLEEPK